MGAAKNLFVGVYTESGILRLLFLPMCYVFLLSPFAALLSRYYKLHRKLAQYIPETYKAPDVLPQIIIALVTVFLATRLISGAKNGSGKVNGKRRVQLLPFWIPGVRHWGNVVFGGEGWLKGVRESSISNVIAYNFSGRKHNVFFSAALLDQVLGNSGSLTEAELTKWTTLRNAFALPQRAKKQYLELQPLISTALADEIFKGRQLKSIVSASLNVLSEALPDLVTFNSSIVDQLQWERVAGIELTDGTDEAETDLFALINEFFCSAIVPPITGSHFFESYQLLPSDLSTFNQSYYGLALGLPRYFPLPGLPGASLSRKRLLREFTKVHDQLTHPPAKRVIADDESLSGEEETDADVPTPLTRLNELFTKHDLPITARAAITLEVAQRIVAQAVPLAFWTILHIHRISASAETEQEKEQSPISRIRQETKAWAEAIQPPSIHPSFPSPPQISFAAPTPLFNPSSFPYLRSCIFEAKRLYSSSITTAKITKPITFTDTTVPGTQEEWQLDAGSYIDIGLSQRLINTSPANYLSPESYNPTRFASTQPPAPLSSSAFDDSDELVTALLMAFVAGIVQLWDIQAAPKKGFFEHMQEAQAAAMGEEGNKVQGKVKKVGRWVVPEAVEGSRVRVPRGDVKIRIRRREGLDGPRTMRKGR